MIQPKPFLENLHKLRNSAYGVERRRNMTKMVLEHALQISHYLSLILILIMLFKNGLKKY